MVDSHKSQMRGVKRISADKPPIEDGTYVSRVIPSMVRAIKVILNVLVKTSLAMVFGWLMIIGSVSTTRH